MSMNLWLLTLLLSILALIIVIIRKHLSPKIITYTISNISLAAIILYVINHMGLLGDMQIAINFYTIGTIVLLGIPGLCLLLGIQSFIL
ncbi:pro-sigmaK processing inhibitor BofA family protein [Marinicrinis sediminis]|uniref:Pro-sigmaK processing inhibitor BofA family protein n=1 Tax=Marinicrinis sediminis TaxID=1652465 RepID=A0ABW5REA8_9BACL